MTKHELESPLEQRSVDKIEAAGGRALKLIIPGVRGFLDRTICMPGGKIWFAEFKRLRTGRISAQQEKWSALLTRLGFHVYFIATDAQFDEAMARETVRK
jgi:hypothetical protein